MPAREAIHHVILFVISFAKKAATGLWAGSLAAAAWASLSLALALFAFKRAWPLSILLPSGAIFYLAIAWFHFLRGDGLGRKPEELSSEAGTGIAPRGPSRTRSALLWAATELVALAALLYSLAGIGPTY